MKPIIRILSLAIGLNMLAFGVHQVARPAKWTKYIPDFLTPIMPLSKQTFMRVHGTGNVSLGLVLMSLYKVRYTSLVTVAWWLFVTPFCARQDWQTGLRDSTIVAAAIALTYAAYHDAAYEL